ITVPWDKVRNDIAAVLPVRRDKRSIFVVPWEGPDGTVGPDGFTYIGTTDTDHDGPLDDPQCTEEDIEYLLEAVNGAIRTPIDRSDVLGTWAGLRPLVKAAASGRTADLSRRHRVALSEAGVVTVTGGKLTTYREMAEDTVDAVVEHLRARGDRIERGDPARASRGRTANLRIRGADGWEEAEAADAHLAHRYGSEYRVLQAMIDTTPDLGEPLVKGLPYRRAEAVYAVRYEMATTLDDVLSRRTRARLLDREATAAAAEDVAALVGAELGWSADEQARQVAAYRQAAERERQPVAEAR
ncbi:MAG TPA: glycerol-3-phosphate dehydrogenase C-terminal domain-containing protein, partial [Acidimicrobiales bacterium]